MTMSARGISLHLSGFDLLRNISLEVEAGKVTTIVGPNGAGKSSLLKVLTGEMPPTAGDVYLNSRLLNQWSLLEKAQMLAVLPQHTLLNFSFTADEVVGLGRIPHQTGSAKDVEIVAEALELVDASYLQRRFYTQMSGGEKQRVQLARVLAQIWQPSCLGEQFLVLDEPTSAFDLSHQKLTLDIVRQLAQKGVGVVMVVHDLNLAARCADNIVVIDGGVIAAQGSPEVVLTETLIDKVFGVKSIISEHPITKRPLVIT
ncbi:MAG: iron complex transport system ATP-binding protein [Porticoccaceae bacterium]|jgi:iron complex transport system ATP-binding protein|nr:heme ABC transporter ATP-binding protein [SAR92 clade bacterium]MDB9978130.1 heme ABC transporter ATP-binding protein [Porticoccaceae bacterium]